MKICHFSDSHLGVGESHRRRAPSGLTERQEDVMGSFNEAIDKIIAIKPDLCIHSGDLFHAVRPMNSIMARAAEQLHRLAAEYRIPTVVIAGNHDAPRQPYVGAAIDVFRRIENLYVAAAGRLERFHIGSLCVHALPHCLTAVELRKELERCAPDAGSAFNVLVMHGVAAGMPEFSMADLGELELPLEIMDRFDYTALGHYHNFCQVSRRAWYAGSTERLSQTERDSTKGFIVVELAPFSVRFEPVRSRAMVDLEPIDASGQRGDHLLETLRETLDRIGAGDKIVRIKIANVQPETLRTLPVDILAELKQKAFALDLRFEKSATSENDSRFGRSAVGRLDQSLVRFIEDSDLKGFDKERLVREALKYLGAEA